MNLSKKSKRIEKACRQVRKHILKNGKEDVLSVLEQTSLKHNINIHFLQTILNL